MSLYLSRPWLKAYKLGPFKLAAGVGPIPRVPIHHFLDETARRYPQRPACLYGERQITYLELQQYVDRLAAALRALGVREGDRVATVLPTSPQYAIADYAISKNGAVHVPCSVMHRAHELAYELGESGAEVVICFDRSRAILESVRDRTRVKTVIATAPGDFAAGGDEQAGAAPGTRLRDLLREFPPQPPPAKIDPDNDLAVLCFTGGATGRPKGVMLTHANLVANTLQSLPWMMAPLEHGIKGKASILIAVPTFHAYGHWAVRAAVHWGLQMIMLPDPRHLDQIVGVLRTQRPFLAVLVPTQYMKLVDREIGRTNTTFVSGTAPLPPEVARRFRKQTGMPISEGYGLTESGPAAHFNLSSFSKITGFMPFEKLGSIGVPIPDTEAQLLDPDTGRETPVGEVGELYLRGPQLMRGYWPTPGAGLRDGWLPTGDLCRMDAEGYFYLVDRNKDMINVSGNKVYSVTVDEVLFEHPAVEAALTIGVPDPGKPGVETIKAFVVLRQGHSATPQEIIAHCRGRLAAYAVPRAVDIRDSLPTTVTEKLFKREVREAEGQSTGP